jgi:hypothetical protein
LHGEFRALGLEAVEQRAEIGRATSGSTLVSLRQNANSSAMTAA